MRRGRLAARQQLFDEIRALFEGGNSIGEIARKLGLGRRRVERWVRRIDLPDRNTMTSTPSNPAYFSVLLERRWAEGITKVRHLFAEIRHRGYRQFPRYLEQQTFLSSKIAGKENPYDK